MRIDINVPTKWNELSAWQAERIGRILLKNEEVEKITYRRMMTIILLLFPKPSFKTVLKLIIVLTRVPLKELEYLADFICEQDNDMTVFPEAFFVKNKGGKYIKVYGPGPRLSNVSIQELSYADAFYYNWRSKGDDVELHKLCAVLYRPAGGRNPLDRRQSFNVLLLPDNAELTDQIPLYNKIMIAMAFQGTREVLASRYKKVFPKRAEPEEGEKEPAKPAKYTPFTKIINAMALDEVNPFGTLEGAERANAHKFLEIYNEQLIRMARREAEMDKHKNKRRG